jgi:hypothetical protein
LNAVIAYPLAAIAEIAGCFAVWAWWRLGASPLWLLPGMIPLALFGWLLAQVETSTAHRCRRGRLQHQRRADVRNREAEKVRGKCEFGRIPPWG